LVSLMAFPLKSDFGNPITAIFIGARLCCALTMLATG
jgi:hypothetical protein